MADIITEDGKIITTEDGKEIVTEDHVEEKPFDFTVIFRRRRK